MPEGRAPGTGTRSQTVWRLFRPITVPRNMPPIPPSAAPAMNASVREQRKMHQPSGSRWVAAEIAPTASPPTSRPNPIPSMVRRFCRPTSRPVTSSQRTVWAVPSGVATSVATVLAGQGVLSYGEVALAAVAGGWTGDGVGYWIGRLWGNKLVPSGGRLGAAVTRARDRAERFFGRHPFYSVTVARLVSFVRTLMPLGAGSSGLSYRRYLVYELPGLLGWAAMYMAAGALAGESWELATSLLGVGWVVVFLVAGVVLWAVHRRRAAT